MKTTALVLLAVSITVIFSACATGTPSEKSVALNNDALNTWAHISCINQEMKVESNLAKYERNFVVVPYKKIKKLGKERAEKDADETENLYFDRASKMAEKILTDAGLKKVNSADAHTLTIALAWSTKKQKLSREEVIGFVSKADGKVPLKMKPGQIYSNFLHLKAIAPDKKTTRWDLSVESLNSDTFYLDVLPPLFFVGKDYLGKSCDQLVQIPVTMSSPEIDSIRE